MKKRLLVLLVVLSLSAISGLHLVAAQSSTTLQAVTLDAVSLVAEPSETADAVVDVPANTLVTLLGTDSTKGWLQVEDADGNVGYGPAASFLVLNPPLLGQVAQVNNPRTQSEAGLFAAPDFGAEIVGTVPFGTTATVLGTSGQWAYILAPDGTTGWSVATPFVALPEGSYLAQVSVNSDAFGIFAEANITSDIVTTVPSGSVLWVLGVEDKFAQVLTMDGQTGYAVAAKLSPLPTTKIDVSVNQATAGIYAEPNQTADILTDLGNGVSLTYMGDVDEFWVELFDPSFGDAYGLKVNFGSPYYVAATVQASANVRTEPNKSTGAVLATLPAGTNVLVKGKSANGLWVNVVIPFSDIQYPWKGVEGWMRDWLFADANGGNSTLNMDILAVTE